MNSFGYIYVLTCLVNMKEYVGQAKCWKKRWKGHRYSARVGASNIIYRAMRKYGVENFALTIVRRCPIEELNYWEEYYIDKFDTLTPDGYNMTEGGEGLRASAALRKRMSCEKLAYYKANPSVIEQISAIVKALMDSHPDKKKVYGSANIGRSPSAATRNKLSKKGRGRIFTLEVRKAIGHANTGKVRSAEQRKRHGELVSSWWAIPENKRRMKKSLIAAGLARRGKSLAPEHVEKIRIGNIGKTPSELTKARQSNSAKKRWRDPIQRRLTSEKLRAYFADPVNREKNRQAQLNGANSTAAARAAASEKTKAYFANPANREKHRQSQLRLLRQN